MARRKRSRRNPSTRRSGSRRSGDSGPFTVRNVAIGAGAVYGLGALVTLGMEVYAATQGTGRAVYATDLVNALAWPLVLASGGRMGIAPSGPQLVASRYNGLQPLPNQLPTTPTLSPKIPLTHV